MPIEEEYKGRGGSSGGKSTGGAGRTYGGGGNNNSSSTPKYDLSSEEVKKLSPEKKAEYHRYDTHSWGMWWLAFLLMFLAIIISVIVYYHDVNDFYNNGLLTKFFGKYKIYVKVGLIFVSLATASIFSGIESTKAADHMKKLLADGQAEQKADGQAEQKAKNDKTKAEHMAEYEKVMAAKMLAKNDMPPPPPSAGAK